MDQCPSDEQLAGFVENALADALVEQIREHVAECNRCARWIAEAKAANAILRDVGDVTDIDTASGEVRAAREDEASSLGAGSHEDSFPGYRVVRELHRGGQGIVYEAIQKSTRPYV